MWLIRYCKKASWAGIDPTNSEEVDRASLDLRLRDGESGLLVYKVEGRREAVRLSKLWGLTNSYTPQRVDFLLIPESLLEEIGLRCVKRPNPLQVDDLSNTHHEVDGVGIDQAIILAQAILSHPSFSLEEVSRKSLKNRGLRYKKVSPEVVIRMTPKWQRELLR